MNSREVFAFGFTTGLVQLLLFIEKGMLQPLDKTQSLALLFNL